MPVATEDHHRKIAEMTFGTVYPCYVTKVGDIIEAYEEVEVKQTLED